MLHKATPKTPAMTIKVGIHTFPCEGGMAQMMVCRGITIRLKKEHPGAEVFVGQVVGTPNKVEVALQNFGDLNPAKIAYAVRRTVLDSLARVTGDYPSAEQHLDDKFMLACKVGDLQREKKRLRVALRELASATEQFILTKLSADREIARKAVAEAEGILSHFKPRYVGDGPLTLAEMVRALRNIHYDLTCDRCAAQFYLGKVEGEHSLDCHTVKADGSAEKEV